MSSFTNFRASSCDWSELVVRPTNASDSYQAVVRKAVACIQDRLDNEEFWTDAIAAFVDDCVNDFEASRATCEHYFSAVDATSPSAERTAAEEYNGAEIPDYLLNPPTLTFSGLPSVESVRSLLEGGIHYDATVVADFKALITGEGELSGAYRVHRGYGRPLFTSVVTSPTFDTPANLIGAMTPCRHAVCYARNHSSFAGIIRRATAAALGTFVSKAFIATQNAGMNGSTSEIDYWEHVVHPVVGHCSSYDDIVWNQLDEEQAAAIFNAVTGFYSMSSEFTLGCSSTTSVTKAALERLVELNADRWLAMAVTGSISRPRLVGSGSSLVRLWKRFMWPSIDSSADDYWMWICDPYGTAHKLVARYTFDACKWVCRKVAGWFSGEPVYRLRGFGMGTVATKHDWTSAFTKDAVAKLTLDGVTLDNADWLEPYKGLGWTPGNEEHCYGTKPLNANACVLGVDGDTKTIAGSAYLYLKMESYGWYDTPLRNTASNHHHLPNLADYLMRQSVAGLTIGEGVLNVEYGDIVPDVTGFPPAYRHLMVHFRSKDDGAKNGSKVGTTATITYPHSRIEGVGVQGIAWRLWGSGNYDLITANCFRDTEGHLKSKMVWDNTYSPKLMTINASEVKALRS